MNFLPNPGFTLSIRNRLGKNQKHLAEYISIIFSANTRLKDIVRFCHPMLAIMQKQLDSYFDSPENITEFEEQLYSLAPHHNKPQTNKTWLVSTGTYPLAERPGIETNSPL